VNADYTKHLDGWTAEESAPLLELLYAQFARPELTYRHRWHVGDLLIWDNRCTQHCVVGDTYGQERELHRITIAG
jgi:taurine dioxygenase